MKPIKKIGPALLCPIPFLIMLLVQTVCTSLGMLILAIVIGNDTYETVFFDHYTAFLTITQILTLLLFGSWYYLAYCKGKPFAGPAAYITRKSACSLILLGLGLYCVISVVLVAISFLAPNTMTEYEALIAETGLADLTLLSTIATLILAPLSEELVFRGITLRYAQKAFGSFFIANTIQALLFGIGHLNLIQGLYAFLLGLVLGYVSHKLRTLYASILLHLAFNFFGTWFAVLLGFLPFPEHVTAMFLLLAGAPLTWYCLRNLQPK